MNKDYCLSSVVGQAWHTYINEGYIGDHTIRPEIQRSWKRSKRVDPFMGQPDSLPEKILRKKNSQNDDLIAAAEPLMQYMYAFSSKNYMLLCDKDGYVIQKNYAYKYPYTMGCNCNDDYIGTNSIGIALNENRPIRIEGYENYAIRYHTYSEVSAPVGSEDGSLIGVITILNPFVKIDNNALQWVILAKKIIENELSGKSRILEKSPAFLNIINSLEECIMVIDNEGCILSANQQLLNSLNQVDISKLTGKPVDNYIKDSKFTSAILKNKSNLSQQFSINTNDGLLKCSVLNWRYIENNSGSKNILLLFNPQKIIKNSYRTNIPVPWNDCTGIDTLVGESKEWQKIKNTVIKVARVDSTTILLEGESGTGKELVAKAIHSESGREGNYVAINCGAIPKDLLQSELFGYEEGSFTGARKGGSAGKIELADGGTLFLDEIGEMPMDMQVSLLRVLEERSVNRLGSNEAVRVDINLIAATNRNLREAIKKGEFREDLYYRLNVINLKLPPIRERREDIPLLVDSLITQLAERLKIQRPYITNEAVQIFMRYHWPGNVRELKNVLERAMILANDNCISADLLPAYLLDNLNNEDIKEDSFINELSGSDTILKVLKKNNGNISKTAKELGIARNTLYKRVKKIDIVKARHFY